MKKLMMALAFVGLCTAAKLQQQTSTVLQLTLSGQTGMFRLVLTLTLLVLMAMVAF